MTKEPPKIAPEFAKVQSRQSYGAKPKIHDVAVVELKRFVEEGGELAELTRLNEDGSLAAIPHFKLRQINHAVVAPGAIKAFHVHLHQADVWFVPPEGRLLLGLFDPREGSPTKGVRQKMVLGAGRALLVYIPPGVAHGCANLERENVTMLYLHDRQFDANEPDEHRIPWDVLGADFWAVKPG